MNARFAKRLLSVMWIVVLALGLLPLAAAQEGPPDYWPTEGWRTSTPEEQGMDSSRLLEVLDIMQAQELSDPIHNLLVIRHGYVVLDASLYPYKAAQPHAMYSVTKSFLSTVVGIAIDKGYIESVDQSIWDFFDPADTAEMDEQKEALQLKHLLTMTSSLSVSDIVDVKMYGLTGEAQPWVQMVLDLPMHNQPGTGFIYADSVAQLTSGVVSQATGMSAFEVAKQYLFTPLGITDAIWLSDPQGVSTGGDGLYVSAYDMAKLGFLFLHQGEWDGQQVVSSAWVDAATHRAAECGGCPNYGYYWWLAEPDELPPGAGRLFQAIGYAGQRILVFPEKDLIIVLTGGTNGAFSSEDRIVFDEILPAVTSDTALPANPEAAADLKARTAMLAQPVASEVPAAPTIQRQVSGRTFVLGHNPMDWVSIAVDFGDSEALLTLTTSEGAQELPIGLDGVYRITPVSRPAVVVPLTSYFWPFPRLTEVSLAAKGKWRDDTTFLIWIRDLVGLETWLLSITYEQDGIKLFVAEGLQGLVRDVSGTPQP